MAAGLACSSAYSQVVLNIDQSTGAVEIANTSTTDPVNINGYQIQSPQGSLLDLVGWADLETSLGAPGGWVAGDSLSNASLAETNAGNVLSLGPGASQSLGNAFTTNAATIGAAQANAGFGNAYLDVAFTYNNADDPSPATSIVSGGVNVANEVFNDLVLNVDVAGGTIELVNESSVAVTIGFYNIFSAAGSLNTAWNGLSDEIPESWEMNGAATANALAEIASLDTSNGAPPGTLSVDDLLTIPGGASFDLGDAFLTGGALDLEFQYFLTSDGATGTEADGEVRFLNAAEPGDYNGDTVVSAADFVVWRDVNGNAFPLNGRDPNNTGDVNLGDYDFWVENFGGGAGGAAGVAAPVGVPEPAAGVMLSIFAALAVAKRR